MVLSLDSDKKLPKVKEKQHWVIKQETRSNVEKFKNHQKHTPLVLLHLNFISYSLIAHLSRCAKLVKNMKIII